MKTVHHWDWWGYRFPVRTRRTSLALASLLLTAGVAGTASSPAGAVSQPRQVSYHSWASGKQLATGTSDGVAVSRGQLLVDAPRLRSTRAGTAYDVGRWTSPWVTPGFGLTELVPSWEARTPEGTFVQVQVRGVSEGGTRGSWDTLGQWASGDRAVHRTSQGAQADDVAHVATDTWIANYGTITSWQLRVSLFRKSGTTLTPRLDTVGAMVSELPPVDRVPTSRPGVGRGIVLDVPTYSQMIHAGEYPQYGGGGEAWCSPTSTTMVLGYYDALPKPAEYAWVKRSYADRVVDHSARMTYDYGYDGTGNWPFNTAYAANHAGHAFVTRFKSLVGVERLVAAGIPVVTSVTFGRGELHGAPISATNGHLVVVVGFTQDGDVVVNDPAASSAAGVRRTYDRGEFENAWFKRYPSGGSMRGSGGLAYVIRDDAHPLPARRGTTAW